MHALCRSVPSLRTLALVLTAGTFLSLAPAAARAGSEPGSHGAKVKGSSDAPKPCSKSDRTKARLNAEKACKQAQADMRSAIELACKSMRSVVLGFRDATDTEAADMTDAQVRALADEASGGVDVAASACAAAMTAAQDKLLASLAQAGANQGAIDKANRQFAEAVSRMRRTAEYAHHKLQELENQALAANDDDAPDPEQDGTTEPGEPAGHN